MLSYGAVDFSGSDFDKAIEAMIGDNKIDEDIILNSQIQAYFNTGKVQSDWNQWAEGTFIEFNADEIGISETKVYPRDALVFSKAFASCMPLIGYNNNDVVFTHVNSTTCIDRFFRDMNGTGSVYAIYRPKPKNNVFLTYYENLLNNNPQVSGYCICLNTISTINCAFNDVTREAFVWSPS